MFILQRFIIVDEMTKQALKTISETQGLLI